MTYEERIAEICDNCIYDMSCSLQEKGKETYCRNIEQTLGGYKLGQQDTLEEIEKALNMDDPCDTCSAIVGIVEQLKKGE